LFGKAFDLLGFGVGDFIGIDTANIFPFFVNVNHDSLRLREALVENIHQHINHEFHTRIVVVMENHPIHIGLLDLHNHLILFFDFWQNMTPFTPLIDYGKLFRLLYIIFEHIQVQSRQSSPQTQKGLKYHQASYRTFSIPSPIKAKSITLCHNFDWNNIFDVVGVLGWLECAFWLYHYRLTLKISREEQGILIAQPLS